MSKKILVISDYRKYHSTRPEAEIYLGLAKEGFSITIMTFPEAGYIPKFKSAGIKVIPFHPVKKFNNAEIKTIRNEVKAGQYDFIVLYNNFAIINGLRAVRGIDIKVILYRGYAGNIKWYDPISYTKFLHPKVDKIICNAQVVKDYIDGVPFFNKNKSIVIHKGHDLKWYQNVEAGDLRGEIGISKDAFIAINICNNRTMKGIPYLLKAMNQLSELKNIHLVIVGKGMETQENLSIIDEGKMKDQIHLMGFRKDALNLLKDSNTFVLSSIKGESNTKALIEAMALKKACIITDIKGNIHLLERDKSALIVPKKNATSIADAISQLYNDPVKTTLLGEGAQNRFKSEINISKTIEEMKDLFSHL